MSQAALPPTLVDHAERERIRTSLDETLIVEAAAGTGKTSEMARAWSTCGPRGAAPCRRSQR